MRLIKIKIQNFRCYRNETTIDLDDLTVFIGKNDSGKSSIIDALDIFFNRNPDKDDVCVHGNDKIIKITCVFDTLPEKLVIDELVQTNLKDEYLLNSDKNLEIIKSYDCSKSKIQSSVFLRAIHPTAVKYDDLLTLNNAKLKQRLNELSIDVSGINLTVNSQMRTSIWNHAQELMLQITDIEAKAETALKIWNQLEKNLPVFALFKSDRSSTDQDGEAQDPLKSAIKESIKAQEKELSEITDRVKKEVQEIANLTVKKIKEMNPALASQLNPRVSNKNWDSLFSVTLTGDEEIPVNKRGSGTRRLILLNFFRARAEKMAENNGTGIIYAIEEPETSQHPYNQIMLVDALSDLVSAVGCQVFITTHTPVLARRLPQDSLRFVYSSNNHPVLLNGSDEPTLSKIVESLGVLPDHNIKAFLFVEGRHDISFLRAISKIIHDDNKDIPDLNVAEDNGHLIFIPLGGSILDLWISKLKGLNRPEFYVLDRDAKPPSLPKYQNIADQLAKNDNSQVWITNKKELENYIHPDIIKKFAPIYKGTGNDFEDVPVLLAQAIHDNDDSSNPWDSLSDEKIKKKEGYAKRKLNNDIVGLMTPVFLADIDKDNEICIFLKKIGDILKG